MSKRGRRPGSQPSQQSQNEDIGLSPVDDNLDELINNTVRFLINNSHGQGSALFRKTDLQKHIFTRSTKNFEAAMRGAQEILKNVYGMNLILYEQGRSLKTYLLSNGLPFIDYGLIDDDKEKGANRVLLLLVLSHIFMSDGRITEGSLENFLGHLGVRLDEPHELFGNVRNFIYTVLVKQKYVAIEKDLVTKEVGLMWGVRAELEISKHELLKFVVEIYRDGKPELWTKQFEAANDQDFRNDPITDNHNEETMED